MDPRSESGGTQLAKLVAACLHDYSEGGIDAVQGVLDEHPEHADELRKRLQSLAKFGLLEGAEQTPHSFGPYAIRKRLGRGGMSEVFLAYDPRMKREVALKCAHPGLALEERAKQRFQREVEAVAKLSHPAIVPVFDAGEAGGRAYFTMEYAEGATLSTIVKLLIENSQSAGHSQRTRGQIVAEAVEADDPESHVWQRAYIELVCRWMLELCEALEHAHAAGVIHRDVTPANIIVRQNGHAQLFDFGLAMLQDAPSLTVFGEFTGTPYYVSPEQLRGEVGELDERCDIYSIGVTLFELLTLKRPFEGTSTAEVLNRIQHDVAASPRVHNPKIPRDLELICLTALDRDRARRYSSMTELAADLRAFLAFEPVSARPLKANERAWLFIKRRPAFAAAVSLAAVLFIGIPPVLIAMNATIRHERDAAITSAGQATRSAAEATQSAKLAHASADRSKRITNEFEEFLSGLFDAERLGSPNMTVEQLVTRGIERLSRVDAEGDEQIQLALLEATGRVFSRMGLFSQARNQLSRAYDRRQGQQGLDQNVTAKTALNLASALLNMGEFDSSHKIVTQALEVLDPTPVNAAMRTYMHLTLASIDNAAGDQSSAASHLDQALAVKPPDPPLTYTQFVNQAIATATIAETLGRYEFARTTQQATLAYIQKQWRPDPTDELLVRQALLHITDHLPDDDAKQDLDQQVEMAKARGESWSESLASAPPPVTLHFDTGWQTECKRLFDAAEVAIEQGQSTKAVELYSQCLKVHPRDMFAAYNLFNLHAQMGSIDLAIHWMEEAIVFGYGTSMTLDRPIRDEPSFNAMLEFSGPRTEAIVAKLESAHTADLPLLVRSAPDAKTTLVFITPTGAHVTGSESMALQNQAERLGWSFIAITPLNSIAPDYPTWLTNQGDYESDVQNMTRLMGKCLAPEVETAPVIVVSSGDSGPFATHFAIHNAGIVRALVLLDTYPGPEPRTTAMQDAAISGLHIAIVDDNQTEIEWVAPETTQTDFTSSVADWFEALTFDTRTFQSEGDEDLNSIFVAVFERIQALR